MKKLLAAVMTVFALAACSPGLGRENPVPNPNPDHGVNAPSAVYLWWMINDKNDQQYEGHIVGTISYKDINKKPLLTEDKDTKAMLPFMPFNGKGPIGGIEVGFVNPVAMFAEISIHYQGLGGSYCQIELTRDRAGQNSYLGYEIVPGDIVEIPEGQEIGVRTIAITIFRPMA